MAISQTEPVRKTEKCRDESYKEKLTETNWPLFNVLREWKASERKIKARKVRKGDLMHILNCCIHLSIQWTKKIMKKTKMIATETTEHTEGKYSVLSVYSVAEKLYILFK